MAARAEGARLVLHAAGVAALAWIAWHLPQRDDRPVTPVEPPSFDTDALSARLDTLARRLDRLEQREIAATDASHSGAERQEVVGDEAFSSALTAQVAGLREDIRALTATFARQVDNQESRVPTRNRPTDWAEISAFRTDYQKSTDVAKQQLYLMSMSDVTQRFGKPSRVSSTETGIWFYYERKDDKTERVGLFFKDGLVTSVMVR